MDITPYFGIITEEHAPVTKTPFTNGMLLANFKERQVLKLVSRDTVRLTDVDYYETIEDFVDNLNIVIKNIINIFKDYNGILPSKEYIINQFTYRNILGKAI